MDISSVAASQNDTLAQAGRAVLAKSSADTGDNPELREAFHDFVGQTFYGQLLSAMRSTQEKPAYFHGGRAEEVFQNQLDQVLAEKLSEATAETFSEPLYQLFALSRR